MKNEIQLVDSHIENLFKGKFDQDHPFFFHKDYYLDFKRLLLKGDAINQPTVDTLFEIRAKKEEIWDSADVLNYMSRITYFLKSFVQCARICINYDTANMNGGRYKRYATVNVVYLADKQTMAQAREQYLKNKIGASQSPKVIDGEESVPKLQSD